MSYVEEAGNNPYAAPTADLSYPTSSVDMRYGYSGFWRRYLALFLDSLIMGVVNGLAGFVVGFVMAILGASEEVIQVVAFLVGVIVGLAYYVGMLSSSHQATLGKMAMGIKVVDLEGRRIGFGRALGREMAKFLSVITLFIGYIMAAFTSRKQALHDMVAGTLVVRTR